MVLNMAKSSGNYECGKGFVQPYREEKRELALEKESGKLTKASKRGYISI